MTNELAIRILNGDVLGTSEQTHEAVVMAVKALSFSSAQQWIPAHNIFPGENGKYLATGKHGAVNIIKYEDGRWYGGMKPLAWCPLPEPYKEDADD